MDNNEINDYKSNNHDQKMDYYDVNNRIGTSNLVSSIKRDNNKPLEKANFTFCQYLKYIICCFRGNEKMKYYDEFREEMVSEESILQSRLDIYKIKKTI